MNLVALPNSLLLLRKLWIPHKLGVLDRLYGSKLSRSGCGWVRTSRGLIWKLDLENPLHRWLVYGDYGGGELVRWSEQFLQSKPGIVIDSGANIGQTVQYFASIPGVHLYAFEPTSHAANWLQECLSNYPDWDVEVINRGLFDEECVLQIQMAGNHMEQATLRGDWYQSHRYPTETISVVRLDAFASQHGISNIRLWKIDVEGAEVHVLAGARALLEKQAIDAIIVELADSTVSEVLEILRSCGYTMHVFHGSGLRRVAAESIKGRADVVFVPSTMG